MQPDVILNSKLLQKYHLYKNYKNMNQKENIPINNKRNLSQRFINTIKHNYETSQQRLKHLGDKAYIDPEIKKKYKGILDISSTNTANNIIVNDTKRFADMHRRMTRLSHFQNKKSTSLIANCFVTELENKKKPKEVPSTVVLKRATIRTQSLNFLAKKRKNTRCEAISQNKMHSILLPNNKPTSKSFVEEKIKFKKPTGAKNTSVDNCKDNYRIKDLELQSNNIQNNFSDFRFHKHVIPQDGYKNTKKSSLKRKTIINTSSNDFFASESPKNIKLVFKPYRNSIISFKKEKDLSVTNNRRKRIVSKEKNPMVAKALRSYQHRSNNVPSTNILNDAVQYLEYYKKELVRARLHLVNSKKLSAERKLRGIFSNRLNENITEALDRESSLGFEKFEKSDWMTIIEKLLAKHSIDYDTKVGYYKYFRLAVKEAEDSDADLLKHLIDKLKADMKNEKKFDFNFRFPE